MSLYSTLMEPGVIGGERMFRKLMLQVSVLASVIHIAFAVLFFTYDIVPLAIVNIFSVLLYMTVFVLIIRRRLIVISWLAVVVEIVVHATLAVYLLGWESGFHFYAMMIPPVMMVSPFKESMIKVPMVAGMMVLYVLIDHELRGAQPVYLLKESLLNSLYYFNLVLVLISMVFLSGLYYRLVVENAARLQQLATTDALTGLHNRRCVQELAEREIKNHRRHGLPLSVLMCDLDNFKRVNDLFGHLAGDRVLRNFSQVLNQQVRAGDLVARWGGEEFLVLLPSTPLAEAQAVAERVRQHIEQAPVTMADSEIYTTTTIGISELALEGVSLTMGNLAGDCFEQLVARADDALYQGKANGRNCIMLEPQAACEH
ncbi:GGDEF domain-containing protein [Bacterioplanoides sp.]|uniref:GGDEF domain-containing protein n=1 Tax=Bacterioplanoides sp. TaxID=2066072 RepID=UPI003B008AEE